MSDQLETCGICGQRLRVVSGDEGTAHYELAGVSTDHTTLTDAQLDTVERMNLEGVYDPMDMQRLIGDFISQIRFEREEHQRTRELVEDQDRGLQDLWELTKHGYSAAGQIVDLNDEILPHIQNMEDPYESLDEELREMIEGYFSYAYKVATSYRKRFEAELAEQQRIQREKTEDA